MADKKRVANPEINRLRNQKVVKSNELIQRRTHMLTLQEQKIMLFLISQLKPNQKDFEYQTFDIIDFCDICGINNSSGKNYSDLRKAIKTLRDKSMWVIGEETETLMSWIGSAKIEKGKGKIQIRLDEEMKPFLLELQSRYTQFDLIYTLGMKSKYSVRLYEIFKSYEKTNEPVYFKLDRLCETAGIDYLRWQDIKRRAIEPALTEINRLTDLKATYTTQKKGKAIDSVTFNLVAKTSFSEKMETRRMIYKLLDHQQDPPIQGQLLLDGTEIEI